MYSSDVFFLVNSILKPNYVAYSCGVCLCPHSGVVLNLTVYCFILQFYCNLTCTCI